MACQGCDDTDGCLRETQVRNLIAELINSGDFGGYSSEWKFSTTTTSGPATKYLRLDNSTFASVTNLYINETNSQGTNVAAFLGSFSNGSAFGKIRVFKEHASNNYWLGTVTSVTDSGSYYTIGVTYVESNGSFAADDNLIVSFQPAGADGSNGSAGADASAVVHSDISDSAISSDSETEIKAYDFSADADILASNGDELHVDFVVDSVGSTGNTLKMYIGDFAGSSQTVWSKSNPTQGFNGRTVYVKCKIKRISGTSVRINLEFDELLNTSGTTSLGSLNRELLIKTMTADLSALRQVQFTATSANGELTGKELTVRHIQI